MTTFLFSYRAPKNYRGGTADAAAAWKAWFESMGAQLVDRGNPVFEARSLGSRGTDTTLGGYSLITADDFEAAVALAQGCPFLHCGGGVEIGKITVLDRDARLTGEDPT